MNCHELESQVAPYLDGEMGLDERAEIEAHLAACGGCCHKVEVERHNLSLVRALIREGSPAAPARLREAVFTAVHRHEAAARRVWLLRMGATAAGVALVVAVANHQYKTYQLRLYEQDAALRHARHFPLEIQQPQIGAIEAWFGGKLDHPVIIPQFPNAVARGARLLQVRDKPAAYIRYDARRPMGLFVYGDDHDVDVGQEPEVATSHGYNVVSWREGDVVYQLVSDLDEDDLRRLLPPKADDLLHGPAPASPAIDPSPGVRMVPASLRH